MRRHAYFSPATMSMLSQSDVESQLANSAGSCSRPGVQITAVGVILGVSILAAVGTVAFLLSRLLMLFIG